MKCGVALVVSSLGDLIFPILTSKVAKHFAAMDVCIGPRSGSTTTPPCIFGDWLAVLLKVLTLVSRNPREVRPRS